MNKKSKLIFLFLICVITLFAGEIRFSQEVDDFQLFNSKKNKVLNYIIVEPGEKVQFQAIEVDSLIVYSRLLSGDRLEYFYTVDLAGVEKIVNRISRKSNITKTLAGQTVSAYNSFKYPTGGKQDLIIQNNWESDILFKIVASENERDFDDYDYIRFSPQYYENEIALDVSGKLYTYYQVNESDIAFDLQGPVLVKIISRLIFHDNFQNHKGYKFIVYDNGKELASFREKAQRSGKSYFPDMPGKTPSTGDVNIIQLDEGKHHIVIKDGILNRDLIFRLYINKSSIGITE